MIFRKYVKGGYNKREQAITELCQGQLQVGQSVGPELSFKVESQIGV